MVTDSFQTSLEQRPGLQRLVDRINSGNPVYLAVTTWDQLSTDRSWLGLASAIIRAGGQIITRTKRIADLTSLAQVFRTSNWHHQSISETRVHAGRIAFLEGRVGRGQVPFGYLSCPLPNPSRPSHPHKKIAIDPVAAPLVRHIFELRGERQCSLQHIVEQLNAERSQLANVDAHKRWNIKVLQYMFANECYKGVWRWNVTRKVAINGRRKTLWLPESEHIVQHRPHLQIVSTEMWQRAQPKPRPRRFVRQCPVCPDSHPSQTSLTANTDTPRRHS